MEAKAVAKYVRITPYKARAVIDLIRGKDVGEALSILRFTPRAAAGPVEKVIRSAVANAEHNYDMDADSLYIAEAYADGGPTMKRYRPRAQGRIYPILKRSCHITVVVKER